MNEVTKKLGNAADARIAVMSLLAVFNKYLLDSPLERDEPISL